MKIRKNQLMLLSLIVLLFGVYWITPKSNYKIAVILLIDIIGIIYYKFDLKYPFVWLSPFIVIYNISASILNVLGVRLISYEIMILNMTIISLITFLTFCILFIPQKKNTQISLKYLHTHVSMTVMKLYDILYGLVILYIPIFLKSGVSSKTEMSLSGGLFGYGIVSRLYIFIYILLFIYKLIINKKFPTKYFISAALLTLSISFIIGEREMFFSVIICSTLGLCFFCRLPLKRIIIGSLSIAFLIPILGMTKQITNKSELSFSNVNFVEALFQGEFLSSGRNIEILLNNSNNWEYQYGKSMLLDFQRCIFPTSIIPVQNSTSWFNEHFNDRAYTGFGLGFSYIGEGYLQGGYVGIIIWVAILGLIIGILYQNSFKGILNLSIYIFMVPFSIYAMRGDLSYLFSPLLKQGMLCTGLILIIYSLNKHKYNFKII